MNNFFSPHSPGSNCEPDDCEGALDSLKQFITEYEIPETCDQAEPEHSETEDINVNVDVDDISKNIHSYIAGYMAKKNFKTTGSCVSCKSSLLTPGHRTTEHILIEERAYSPKALLRPSTNFRVMFTNAEKVLRYCMPQICNQVNLKQKLLLKIKKNVPNNFTCQTHDMFTIFSDIFVTFFLNMYIKNVNNILRGLDLRESRITDQIKRKAYIKYIKDRSKKDKIAKMKMLTI